MPRMEPPDHFSVSAAETWGTCPKKWHGKYVDKIPDPVGPEADIGKMAHLVLERLGSFKPGRRSPEVAVQLGNRLWTERTKPERREAMGHVVRALRNLEIAAGEPVMLERELRTTLAGVPFLGYLDRADQLPSGALRILDYKTGQRKAGPRNAWLAPKGRQLAIYAAAVEVIDGRPVHQGALIWTAYSPVKVDEFEMDDEFLADALAWFSGVWDEILAAFDNDVFEAKPGALCSWCSLVAGCPEGREAVIERAAIKGKSIGPHGQAVLDEIAVQQFSDTLAVVEGKHLTVVDD